MVAFAHVWARTVSGELILALLGEREVKARYYGYCPIAPGTTLSLMRWFLSTADHIVLLEFADETGVIWKGPEYPRDLAGTRAMDIQNKNRIFEVMATTIDAVQGWSDFIVEEKR